MEFRLGVRARATKDLDVALLDGPADYDALRAELIETLAVDVDHDGFTFSAAAWAAQYPRLAQDRTLAEPDLTVAVEFVRSFWSRTIE